MRSHCAGKIGGEIDDTEAEERRAAYCDDEEVDDSVSDNEVDIPRVHILTCGKILGNQDGNSQNYCPSKTYSREELCSKHEVSAKALHPLSRGKPLSHSVYTGKIKVISLLSQAQLRQLGEPIHHLVPPIAECYSLSRQKDKISNIVEHGHAGEDHDAGKSPKILLRIHHTVYWEKQNEWQSNNPREDEERHDCSRLYLSKFPFAEDDLLGLLWH